MKKRIALLFGGKSAEHDVSVLSAQAIYKNIDRNLFEVRLIGIDKKGDSFLFDEDEFLHSEKPIFNVEKKLSLSELTEHLIRDIDVVFPALHGPYGEDGKLQGYLDFINVPYVGCDHVASALCMDKAYNKYILQDNGFNVIPFEIVFKHEFEKKPEDISKTLIKTLGETLFVKPANMGSSVGISKSSGIEKLKKALALAFEYDKVAVVEKAVNAAEFECGVLGLNEFKVSPVGEIKPSHEFYDYEAKYSEKSISKVEIPAKIAEEDAKYIQDETIRAAKLFRIKGLSRIDYIMDKDDGTIYLSEINTMPGFTKFSMYPSLIEKIGISYSDLITKLINFACE